VSAYLATWYQEGFQVPQNVTLHTVSQAAVDRLLQTTRLAEAALEIPRRVGADATKGELAQDKVRCRRIIHVVKKTMPGWKGYKPKDPGNMKRAAAVVKWIEWYQERALLLQREMNIIAALHYQRQAPDVGCKQALLWTNNEYRWLAYALRD
jgi:hypothetical protein